MKSKSKSGKERDVSVKRRRLAIMNSTVQLLSAAQSIRYRANRWKSSLGPSVTARILGFS